MYRPSLRTLFLCTVLLSSSACSEGDEGTKRVTQMRCESDGLCAEKVGTNSLELGYRRGDRELRMDVIYRRYGRQMASNRPFSVRIMDTRGAVFMHAASGSDPDGWNSDNPVPISDENDPGGLEERNEMCHRMLEAMNAYADPSFTGEDSWVEAKEHLQNFVTFDTRPADEVTQTRYFYTEFSSDPQQGLEQDFATFEQEATAEEQAVHGVSEGDGLPESNVADIGQLSTSTLPFGHFAGLRKRNIDYAKQVVSENFEFKQEIDLWNQNTKSFLFGGWKTKKHHSASHIKVFYRPRDSAEPWRTYISHRTKNHGSRPGEGAMRRYAECRDFPTTKGYFNWKGECDGLWATGHLCNDDTAYQVWHAYGGWNGGRHCIGKKRGRRPSCEKPW